jgi:hypothetical protein
MAATTMHALVTVLEDRPGSLAEATDAVGAERINIEGGFSVHCGGESIWRGLFRSEQDAGAAKRALENAGFTVREQRVVVVTTPEDRPGAAAKVYRAIANAGVNLEFTCMASNTRMVIGTQEPEKVAQALGG